MITPLLEAVFHKWSPRREKKVADRQTDRQRQAATPAALTAAYFEDDESKSRSE